MKESSNHIWRIDFCKTRRHCIWVIHRTVNLPDSHSSEEGWEWKRPGLIGTSLFGMRLLEETKGQNWKRPFACHSWAGLLPWEWRKGRLNYNSSCDFLLGRWERSLSVWDGLKEPQIMLRLHHVVLVTFSVHDWSLQCPSNAIWPFKIYHSQNNPSKCSPELKNEDVTWSPQYNLPTTRTNKRRALSLQEVELDGWFLILHIVLETCTT